MKIISVYGCPYEDYKGQILELSVTLNDGESVSIGDVVSIEMMDDSLLEAEIKIINPKLAGDFSLVSQYAAERVASGEFGMSDNMEQSVEGPCATTLVVLDVPYHEVKTDGNIRTKELIEEMRAMICLSPFKELHCGCKSIHEFVQEGYSVPDQVIKYLKTTQPYIMSPGIYDHPFKPGEKLLGPYMYTDGKYYWDRDLWKYVLKYHVTLPQEFVDHAMSKKGSEFIEQWMKEQASWSNEIQNMKAQEGMLCLLPDNAGDMDLEDF